MLSHVKITCHYCGQHIRFDFDDFITDISNYEREMGCETEYSIECEFYECPYCAREFSISGSVWEYPEGVVNLVDLECITTEDDEESDAD